VVRDPQRSQLERTSELRPVISTHVAVGEHVWPIELTLTNRDEMGFSHAARAPGHPRTLSGDGGRSISSEPQAP